MWLTANNQPAKSQQAASNDQPIQIHSYVYACVSIRKVRYRGGVRFINELDVTATK